MMPGSCADRAGTRIQEVVTGIALQAHIDAAIGQQMDGKMPACIIIRTVFGKQRLVGEQIIGIEP